MKNYLNLNIKSLYLVNSYFGQKIFLDPKNKNRIFNTYRLTSFYGYNGLFNLKEEIISNQVENYTRNFEQFHDGNLKIFRPTTLKPEFKKTDWQPEFYFSHNRRNSYSFKSDNRYYYYIFVGPSYFKKEYRLNSRNIILNNIPYEINKSYFWNFLFGKWQQR